MIPEKANFQDASNKRTVKKLMELTDNGDLDGAMAILYGDEYTAGVLDVFMQKGISTDAIYGVSAGALFGINYCSKQIGRVLRYNKKYINK